MNRYHLAILMITFATASCNLPKSRVQSEAYKDDIPEIQKASYNAEKKAIDFDVYVSDCGSHRFALVVSRVDCAKSSPTRCLVSLQHQTNKRCDRELVSVSVPTAPSGLSDKFFSEATLRIRATGSSPEFLVQLPKYGPEAKDFEEVYSLHGVEYNSFKNSLDFDLVYFGCTDAELQLRIDHCQFHASAFSFPRRSVAWVQHGSS